MLSYLKSQNLLGDSNFDFKYSKFAHGNIITLWSLVNLTFAKGLALLTLIQRDKPYNLL